MARPIHLAFVWHLHQPYYKDDLTDTYLLPWVRLRSTKDYNKMAALLEAYPGVRQTFNLVPSLLVQIEDYGRGEGHYQDLFWELSRKPAAELTAEERAFIVRWMRETPQFLRVQASPRYRDLAGRPATDAFTTEEIRDLQVWCNLAWCDPTWTERDPRLSALKARDRDFTEADKDVLFAAQLEMVRSVIPTYAELARRGQAELTFSPYYHPILPLLCDLESAREAVPGIELPERRFAHPEDALGQIEAGRREFERLTGVRPRGMWPSELAVGECVAELAVRAGIDWFLSDEEVLGRSLGVYLGRDGEGRLHQPELLYRPWRIEREGGAVTVVFRDTLLSNRIGFDYHRMPAREAVDDFMGRLRRIREQQGEDRDFLVVVALDGENPWDFYPREGRDFLETLYETLERADDVVCTTVAGFLDQHPERQALPRLHAGSWIGASFDTWIGDPEHRVAWELLAETRDWLEDFAGHHAPEPGQPADGVDLEAAWREISIVEGSDWFWWFSRRHDSGMDAIWDNQFRLHLRNVYKLCGARPPTALFVPILDHRGDEDRRLPRGLFTPRDLDDPVWERAGRYEAGSGFGALHKPVEIVERLLYGCDEERLHVRIDSSRTLEQLSAEGVTFWLYLSGEVGGEEIGEPFATPLRPAALADLGFEPGAVVRVTAGELTVARLNQARTGALPVASEPLASPLWFSVPFRWLEKVGGEPLQMALVVTRDGRDVEHVPPVGALGLRVPREAGLVPEEGRRLRVLIAAAEVAPFAKAGGLADVTAALAKELRRRGHDVRLLLPRYRQVSVERHGLEVALPELRIPLGDRLLECAILEGRLQQVPVYFVDCPSLYDRDGMYGFADDAARFIYLSRAAIEMLRPLGFMPDVIHVHEWQTALVPNLLDRLYERDPELSGVATVLTIHNLAFQGSFGPDTLRLAELEGWGLIKVGIPHLDEVVNFLGRGIYFADAVNTVSERYAEEIQTPEYGEGLDELLRANAYKLYGIVNGIDTEIFDPATDPTIPYHYSADDPSPKALNRARLRAELGLTATSAPLIAFISRFYEQKGLDLIQQALPALCELDLQLAVLGAGDRRYEDVFRHLAARRPGRFAAYIGFDSGLAQRLYAGADMLLMPSRFEPCGLGQLIALRYGTIPIVRSTGGLADTVEDFDPVTDRGYGFTFRAFDPWQLFGAVVRALETFKHVEVWDRLVRRAMRRDVSWQPSAAQYVALYRSAMGSRRGQRSRRGATASGLPG
ncbi:MAG TPA: glycogen/starch synthase [Candidatus Dormibacteraeota bacterium]|jgi:starch synthase|nr:glycogen/starch synthase [Candidatus Dormibacteraeota bacterium]